MGTAKTLDFFYDENPVGNWWTLYDTWAGMHYAPPQGIVYSVRISNDAVVATHPHSHIFVSFKGAVKHGGLMTPLGIHYRLKAGEEKTWTFASDVIFSEPELSYIWLKCNDAAEEIPVPKRISVWGNTKL